MRQRHQHRLHAAGLRRLHLDTARAKGGREAARGPRRQLSGRQPRVTQPCEQARPAAHACKASNTALHAAALSGTKRQFLLTWHLPPWHC